MRRSRAALSAFAIALLSCGDAGRPCAEREAVVVTCDADGTDFLGCPCEQAPIAQVCTPGEGKPCYGGPAWARGVGACVDGMQGCLPDGSGPDKTCEGQVFPRMNICSTSVDESCGAPSACVDDTPLVKTFGDASTLDNVFRTAVDASGGITVLRGTTGVTPIAITSFTNAGASKLDQPTYAIDIAVAPNGRIAFYGPQTTECPATTPNSGTVAMLGADGKCIWAQGYVENNASQTRIAIDPMGDVILSTGATATLTKRRASDGKVVFQIVSVGAFPTEIGTDAEGNVYASGQFSSIVDFGTGPVTTASGAGLFLAKFSTEGQLLFLTEFEAGSVPLRMAVAPNGSVAFFGIAAAGTSLHFGGSTVVTKGTNPSVVVALINADRTVAFGRAVGNGKTYIDSASLAFNADNQILLAANLAGTLDFDEIPVVAPHYTGASTQPLDLFVGAIDPTGRSLWAMNYGGGKVTVNSLAVAPTGAPVVAGFFFGGLDLASTSLFAPQVGTGFVARMAP